MRVSRFKSPLTHEAVRVVGGGGKRKAILAGMIPGSISVDSSFTGS